MTLRDFLRALRKTDRTWKWNPDERILRNANEECPMEAVAQTGPNELINSNVAAQTLKLRRSVAKAIMYAADGCKDGQYRRDLLKACGLTVVK